MSTNVKDQKRIDPIYYLNCIIGLFFMFGFGKIPPFGPLTPVGMQVLGIFIGLLYLWTTAGVAWPSIVGIVALGLSDFTTMANAISSSLGSTVVWQILMVMFLAGAITSSGVGEYIARWIITRKFLNGRPVLFTFMFYMGFFVATVMSNGVACMLLAWTIIESFADLVGLKKGDKYLTLLYINASVACGVGEAVIPFKGWHLALSTSFENISGIPLNYPRYVVFAIGISIGMLLILTLAVRYIFKADMSKLVNFDVAAMAGGVGKLNYRQKSYFYTFLGVIIATLSVNILPGSLFFVKLFKSISTQGIFALAVAVLCMIKIDGEPLMNFKKIAASSIKWESILICASVIPVANALTSDSTGIVELCTSVLVPVFEGQSLFFIIAAIVVIAVFLTNLGSNTGVALLIIPVLVPVCQAIGMSGSLIALIGNVIIFSASIGLVLPGASALAALNYTNDNLEGRDILKYAFFACVVYVIIAIPAFYFTSLAL